MPFVRGRYHLNPVAGQALEAARETEAALQALEHAVKSEQESDGPGDTTGNRSGNLHGDREPVHRVEIEVTKLVPAHSGRAQRGFIARLHRGTRSGLKPTAAPQGSRSVKPNEGASHTTAETHVFADHRDLTGFLNDEFEKDQGE
ncbi:MAG: hypothetical protein WB987_03450 [Candidatus Acidiferrales bacterium]